VTKSEPGAWGITRSPCHWQPKIPGPGHPGFGLNARGRTLFRKKFIAAKLKKVKTGWSTNLAEFSKISYGVQRVSFLIMMMIIIIVIFIRKKSKAANINEIKRWSCVIFV
jgi:hypothetical protein